MSTIRSSIVCALFVVNAGCAVGPDEPEGATALEIEASNDTHDRFGIGFWSIDANGDDFSIVAVADGGDTIARLDSLSTAEAGFESHSLTREQFLSAYHADLAAREQTYSWRDCGWNFGMYIYYRTINDHENAARYQQWAEETCESGRAV